MKSVEGTARQMVHRSRQALGRASPGIPDVNHTCAKMEGDERLIGFSITVDIMEPGTMTRISLSFSVFDGSDAVRTRKFLAHLEKQGQAARIAAALFRSQKASSKAKQYSGGIERSNGEFHSYRSLSYQKKSRSLEELCSLLLVDSAGIVWGWDRDDETPHAPHVLYLDLPTGQVKFHSVERLAGPDYLGNSDGERAAEARIIAYCEQFTEGLVLPPERPREVRDIDPCGDCDTDQWED
jgi:hypothetical protein